MPGQLKKFLPFVHSLYHGCLHSVDIILHQFLIYFHNIFFLENDGWLTIDDFFGWYQVFDVSGFALLLLLCDCIVHTINKFVVKLFVKFGALDVLLLLLTKLACLLNLWDFGCTTRRFLLLLLFCQPFLPHTLLVLWVLSYDLYLGSGKRLQGHIEVSASELFVAARFLNCDFLGVSFYFKITIFLIRLFFFERAK